MSFVALLAGEAHSDDPVTASPVVRRFAITLNDEMSSEMRQTLKSFAPLIIGTRDGHDMTRAALLREVARAELLPRIELEFGRAMGTVLLCGMRRNARTWPDIYQRVSALATEGGAVLDGSGREEMAFAVSRLLCCCGQVAARPEQRSWYWAKAVDILDRLCAVGAEDARPAVSTAHLDSVQSFLAHRHQRLAQRKRAAIAWARMRELIPALVR
jgi:hypothetical protein